MILLLKNTYNYTFKFVLRVYIYVYKNKDNSKIIITTVFKKYP